MSMNYNINNFNGLLFYIILFHYIPTIPQERDTRCHQSIYDNHWWANRVTNSDHELPCLFLDVMELCPRGCFSETDSDFD